MISTVPWHLLVPSVAVAAHWYLVATPKPFFEVFETVRNITGLEPIQKECGNVENRFATKEIDFDVTWLHKTMFKFLSFSEQCMNRIHL